jgi:hypothetical protein
MWLFTAAGGTHITTIRSNGRIHLDARVASGCTSITTGRVDPRWVQAEPALWFFGSSRSTWLFPAADANYITTIRYNDRLAPYARAVSLKMPRLSGLVLKRGKLTRVLLDEIQIGCTCMVMFGTHGAIQNERTLLTPKSFS